MCIPLIQLCSIEKMFGVKKALNKITFDIFGGEILGLLGVNGAGKTTLSSIIATGDILFRGTSIYHEIPSYRSFIGFCPQKPNLNNHLTLEQNLRFAGRYFGMSEHAITNRINELDHKLHLAEYFNQLPEVLSGGYKQRFSIARSIIHKPSLVIFDEPTVALDPHIRHQIWDIIKTMKAEGISILLTTHYLDEAEILSDRVCVLDKGQVQLIDTPQSLMAGFQKKKLEDVFLHLMQEAKK
jgi:ABC-2 type transport system ATP-binding protein